MFTIIFNNLIFFKDFIIIFIYYYSIGSNIQY